MELLNSSEVAKLLRCKKSTVRHYVTSRQIPFVIIGKEAMFRKASIANWLKAREQQPTFNQTKGI